MTCRSLSTAILAIFCLAFAKGGDTLYQAATIDALMQGVYDGTMTFSELKRHGDFGLGTFNALDGEMIALDGKFYQGVAGGKVRPVRDAMKTPFSIVTSFKTDRRWHLAYAGSMARMEEFIDQKIPSQNLFYAVKITGCFPKVKLRSVPRQSRPYRLLKEVVKSQSEFELDSVEGTLVGFRCPSFVRGVNVPGYHFHFISKDGQKGGHVLDFTVKNASIEVDILSDFRMILPKNAQFLQSDLSAHDAKGLQAVEKSHTGNRN